ncbi:hypothetical protein ACFL6C_10740 [Myxococcota bacterium]
MAGGICPTSGPNQAWCERFVKAAQSEVAGETDPIVDSLCQDVYVGETPQPGHSNAELASKYMLKEPCGADLQQQKTHTAVAELMKQLTNAGQRRGVIDHIVGRTKAGESSQLTALLPPLLAWHELAVHDSGRGKALMADVSHDVRCRLLALESSHSTLRLLESAAADGASAIDEKEAAVIRRSAAAYFVSKAGHVLRQGPDTWPAKKLVAMAHVLDQTIDGAVEFHREDIYLSGGAVHARLGDVLDRMAGAAGIEIEVSGVDTAKVVEQFHFSRIDLTGLDLKFKLQALTGASVNVFYDPQDDTVSRLVILGKAASTAPARQKKIEIQPGNVEPETLREPPSEEEPERRAEKAQEAQQLLQQKVFPDGLLALLQLPPRKLANDLYFALLGVLGEIEADLPYHVEKLMADCEALEMAETPDDAWAAVVSTILSLKLTTATDDPRAAQRIGSMRLAWKDDGVVPKPEALRQLVE